MSTMKNFPYPEGREWILKASSPDMVLIQIENTCANFEYGGIKFRVSKLEQTTDKVSLTVGIKVRGEFKPMFPAKLERIPQQRVRFWIPPLDQQGDLAYSEVDWHGDYSRAVIEKILLDLYELGFSDK
ncbi:MAG: hypothetical protein V3U79_09645 [Dehalococcoidia bacterium]